jgi:hypothetical protein
VVLFFTIQEKEAAPVIFFSPCREVIDIFFSLGNFICASERQVIPQDG